MKKYKVEFEVTTKYVVDVLASDEKEASDKATERFAEIKEQGMEHYYQVGDTDEQVGTVYDVTNTDDPFDAVELKPDTRPMFRIMFSR